jgi:hypothetical protein
LVGSDFDSSIGHGVKEPAERHRELVILLLFLIDYVNCSSSAAANIMNQNTLVSSLKKHGWENVAE